jgi:hypothetical protein
MTRSVFAPGSASSFVSIERARNKLSGGKLELELGPEPNKQWGLAQ